MNNRNSRGPENIEDTGRLLTRSKKRQRLTWAVVAVCAVVTLAAAGIVIYSRVSAGAPEQEAAESPDAYMEPVDLLFRAYNENKLEYLEEALTPELYSGWQKDSVTDMENRDSYTVQDTEHVTGAELEEYKRLYGASDCCKVTIIDKMYSPENDTYEDVENLITICKIDGKWKIADIE